MSPFNQCKWCVSAVFYQIYPRSFWTAAATVLVAILEGIIPETPMSLPLASNAIWVSPFTYRR